MACGMSERDLPWNSRVRTAEIKVKDLTYPLLWPSWYLSQRSRRMISWNSKHTFWGRLLEAPQKVTWSHMRQGGYPKHSSLWRTRLHQDAITLLDERLINTSLTSLFFLLTQAWCRLCSLFDNSCTLLWRTIYVFVILILSQSFVFSLQGINHTHIPIPIHNENYEEIKRKINFSACWTPVASCCISWPLSIPTKHFDSNSYMFLWAYAWSWLEGSSIHRVQVRAPPVLMEQGL